MSRALLLGFERFIGVFTPERFKGLWGCLVANPRESNLEFSLSALNLGDP